MDQIMKKRSQRAMDMGVLAANMAMAANQRRGAVEAGGLMRVAIIRAFAIFAMQGLYRPSNKNACGDIGNNVRTVAHECLAWFGNSWSGKVRLVMMCVLANKGNKQ